MLGDAVKNNSNKYIFGFGFGFFFGIFFLCIVDMKFSFLINLSFAFNIAF